MIKIIGYNYNIERGEEKMLTKRQEKIIDYLEKDGSWLTGKELAYLMSVSDRTIRSDVGKINDFYGPY